MTSHLFDLTDRVALITGGSRGIGAGIAEGFAAAGAHVAIASRKLENCEALAARLADDYGVRTLPLAFHAGQWDDSERITHAVHGAFGRCDILVNNAGMSPVYGGDLLNVTEDYYDKVTAVNLKGPFRLSALVGSRMFDAGSGSIINISAVGATRPSADELVYAAAKAGMNALTIGLADAFAPRVRANAILPGAVETDIAQGWSESLREFAASTSKLGRLGTPRDFVGAALWLASDASSWVTGSLIRIDGGAFAQL